MAGGGLPFAGSTAQPRFATADFDQWKTAKKLFETATGKKTPGPKFAGAFRQSSGLATAAQNFGVAFTTIDPAALDRSRARFQDERERVSSGANDPKVAAMKRQADDLVLHAQQVVERLRADQSAILKNSGEIEVLLIASVDAPKAGDTKTLHAKAALVTARAKVADASYTRDAKHVEEARQARPQTLAEIAAFEEKSGVAIADGWCKDAKLDPFFDPADLTLEEIAEQRQKGRSGAAKAAAEKQGLDAQAVFLSRVQT